jgi:hypothetical protein
MARYPAKPVILLLKSCPTPAMTIPETIRRDAETTHQRSAGKIDFIGQTIAELHTEDRVDPGVAVSG